MVTTYSTMINNVERLIDFLKSIEVEAELSSHLENDYLMAHKFYEAYLADPSSNSVPEGRVALGGLHELYKWVWSVKDSDEFEKVKPHLALLVQSVSKINASCPMMSPVTQKQDDKSNKFIEAIVGLFALSAGENLDLDDPELSSNGKNPDVMFDYYGKRVSIACKTLRSKKSQTVLDNIESAAKQITQSDCECGYILLNAMNIADHATVNSRVFTDYQEAFNIIKFGLGEIYNKVLEENPAELKRIFSENPKVCPIVITTLHSTTRLSSPIGTIFTSLKGTVVENFGGQDILSTEFLKLPKEFNLFIHNRGVGA